MVTHYAQCLFVYILSEFTKKLSILEVSKPVIDFTFYLTLFERLRVLEDLGFVQKIEMINTREFRDFFFLTTMILIRYVIYWSIGEVRILQWIFSWLKSPMIPIVGQMLSNAESLIFKLHSIIQGW